MHAVAHVVYAGGSTDQQKNGTEHTESTLHEQCLYQQAVPLTKENLRMLREGHEQHHVEDRLHEHERLI